MSTILLCSYLVWPARPSPPLLFIMLSFIVKGEGSSNSCSIRCAAPYHPHTSVWPQVNVLGKHYNNY